MVDAVISDKLQILVWCNLCMNFYHLSKVTLLTVIDFNLKLKQIAKAVPQTDFQISVQMANHHVS